jgi:hypothetical protein
MDNTNTPDTDARLGVDTTGSDLETRNNRDFGDALIRAVFDEVSGAI